MIVGLHDIILTLAPSPARTDPAPRRWKQIARDLYCRGAHGVFKLEIYSGGTHDAFVGLTGTFTGHATGRIDTITFRFADLLEPNHIEGTNANVSRLSIYVRTDKPWDWYCGLRPVTLKPFHEAIRQWMAVWNER